MRRGTLAALLLVALALPAAARAQGDKSDEASRHFKSGVSFYKDKDFASAQVEFKRAYELLPNYAVLYNLGSTARELKDYAGALSAFDRYLRDGGAKISAARLKEVTAAVEECRKKVARLKVVASVAGAEIGVDAVAVGVAPLAEPVVVNAGRRIVSAKAAGYLPAERTVDVASMEDATVSLDLTKIDTGPKRIEPPPPKKPPLAAWAALGGTGAFAIAAAVTGGLALKAHGQLDAALGMFPGNPQAIAAAQSKTRTFAVATDVLGAVTLAGAAATTVLFVVVPRLGEKTAVGLSPSGVAVRAGF